MHVLKRYLRNLFPFQTAVMFFPLMFPHCHPSASFVRASLPVSMLKFCKLLAGLVAMHKAEVKSTPYKGMRPCNAECH